MLLRHIENENPLSQFSDSGCIHVVCRVKKKATEFISHFFARHRPNLESRAEVTSVEKTVMGLEQEVKI